MLPPRTCFFLASLSGRVFLLLLRTTWSLQIDLNEALIRNVDSTFLGRVVGDSMVEEDIEEGDVLIVDKSLTPQSGDVVISSVNGEFTVKRYELRNGCPALIAGNPSFPPIYVGEWDDFVVWGVVTYVIKKKRRSS